MCLDVPYPVDYGGVFDLFYKLPALQLQDVNIHLHCFEYGRGKQPELNQYCFSVDYYPRKKGLGAISRSIPYIVSSRSSEQLLNRLLEDDYPILLEGIHCTFLLTDPRFQHRQCFVRLHNVEYVYYRHLFRTSSSWLKKVYFWVESKLLFRYEKRIANQATFLAVSEADVEVYRRLGCRNISFLPLFLPPWNIDSHEGKGTFCLYHGHLAVAENEKAAIWLLNQVFRKVEIPFVIAGKNPSRRLQRIAERRKNTCLVANPQENEMQDLIKKAHINIVPSFNATGIKLKLLNVLFNGRHCIVNDATIEGTRLQTACKVANNAEAFRLEVTEVYQEAFSNDDVEARRRLLQGMFDNAVNAAELIRLIWNR